VKLDNKESNREIRANESEIDDSDSKSESRSD
jgi:hypothetical protein